jgi:hypothetical protein
MVDEVGDVAHVNIHIVCGSQASIKPLSIRDQTIF